MRRREITERDLMGLAKRFRGQAGKTRAQAARELGVSQTSIFNAEENPSQSLARLRERMIARYSPYQVERSIRLVKR